MGKLISGKEVSTSIRAKIKEEAQKLRDDYGIQPGLAVILVGNDPASQIYVRNKQKACEEVGFHAFEYRLNENSTQEQLLDLIGVLNKDNKVHGILVQLPLPDHIDPQTVINTISPEKDVDAFHPINVGKIMLGDYEFRPCTPAGVMERIDSTGVEISGNNCVVVVRSNIVGKPLIQCCLQKNATVTVCHSKTKNLEEHTRRADIIIAAIGQAKFVKENMVKDCAVVIDVGINRGEDGKLYGDVDFENVEKKASYITPVPGGVGPMTIAMLMNNVIKATKQQYK